jgi:hypothetical protein
MADNVNKLIEKSGDKEEIGTHHKAILATRYEEENAVLQL